jgi:peptidyl-prolyl cis-trans isomerase SurA
MKPGKREKIRYGKAPTKTLPSGPEAPTEDAGATTQTAQNTPTDALPEAPAPEQKKTRYSERARLPKDKKQSAHPEKPSYPSQNPAAAPDAAEVADRQTQSSALGLQGDANKKKKKQEATTATEKTRLADKKKSDQPAQNATPVQPTPIPAVPGAPAPTATPQPAPSQNPAPAPNPAQPQN